MPTDYANIFRKSPATEKPNSRALVLRDLEKMIDQVDAIVTALQCHQRRIDSLIIKEQGEIDFAARFNALLISKKMPGWKAQFATLTKAVEICDTFRVRVQQIDKTVRDRKKWVADDDLSVNMVDVKARRQTAVRECTAFLDGLKEMEEETGLSFVVSGEDDTERARFIVYD